jgi:hypothetical protein
MSIARPRIGDTLLPGSKNSWREWLFGKPLQPVMLCGELNDPLEAIYHFAEGRIGERQREGKLPWAFLDAWNACEEAMPLEYKHLPYETRQRWVRAVRDLLSANKDALDECLQQTKAAP